jgi:transcriptional regulator GlxA family with amidase domain
MGNPAIFSGIPANHSSMDAPAPFRVAVILCQQALATSITLPVEILRNAEAFARREGGGHRAIAIDTLTPDGESVQSASGFALSPSGSIEPFVPYDLVHVPSLWRSPRPALREHPQYLPWLCSQHRAGAILTAVGTGTCLVAASGLLDGKPATTHWHYFDQFQREYPRVHLQRQYFTTKAGNIYCTAGVNALAELLAHLVYRIYGRSVARHVERVFFHEIRNAFEGSRYLDDAAARHGDEDILQAQIWLQDNFDKPVVMAELAARFGMSLRTFNRRFREAVGDTPLEHLQELRLDTARQLLQNTNLSIGEIAQRCGYQDTAWFATLFRRFYDVTPRTYRHTVRAKLFSSP